ncbi:hypothetical protein THAOC_05498, partial [Thalassiosira oceanica]
MTTQSSSLWSGKAMTLTETCRLVFSRCVIALDLSSAWNQPFLLSLQRCEGDCDNDDECAGSLVCFQRDNDDNPIPGCVGSPYGGYDYCVSKSDR